MLVLLGLLLPSLSAIDYAWPGHGTISLDAPNQWTLMAKQTTEVSYAIKGSRIPTEPDVLQITLVETPTDKPVVASDLLGSLQAMTQPMMATAVEKSISPVSLMMKQGAGLFAEITDASLVGKPPTPEDYKVARSAVVALDDHLLALVTMLFNDPKQAEAADMLSMIESMRFARGTQQGQLAQTQVAGDFEFTVPESKLRLKIPANGLRQDTERIGGGTNSPRYFKLSRGSPNLIVSGWFEPQTRYKGFKQFWTDEMGSWDKRLPPPQSITFVQVGNWEVVSYTLPIPPVTSYNIRAELVQSGTWIDLHLSTTTKPDNVTAKEQLLAALKTIEVTEK